MKIGLLGFTFANANKGCEALTYSFLYTVQKLFPEGVEVCYYSYSDDFGVVKKYFPSIKFTNYKLTRKKILTGLKKSFDSCNFVFDISYGDGFADIYNPKTVRSAMGSIFRVKATRVKSLAELIPAIRDAGRRVFSAELSDNAISLNDAGLSSSDCVIIGNEGHGIPENISSLCDASVYIPISKKTESLNAAVAAAIFMWEIIK